MNFTKFILCFFIYSNISCKGVSCPEDLKSFSIRNSNYEYNCGLPNMDIITKKEIDFICNELSRLQKINFVMTSHHRGYMSIKYNTGSKDFFPKETTLIFTVKNGYVFKTDGDVYKNDVLANYLINLFEIKKVYSDEKCR
ncbi:hypothetical protein LXD69_04840 [Flavobacterium sediminilitoris]|uniref:Uncharacterized protein n=1 Tax=Flavobacterium sediminilitoris TaxID=2024526 RepID=A0ABY4HQI4_9FLAO|nr:MULTISPECIES: hypothetical protein [Flavobacterium]UOX34838.1 hypothetical protein LXD69_04840 [Flavobacterium sediminilitoris]